MGRKGRLASPERSAKSKKAAKKRRKLLFQSGTAGEALLAQESNAKTGTVEPQARRNPRRLLGGDRVWER